jgi:hypothetical protein
MGTDSEQDGGPVVEEYSAGGAGRVKVFFTLEITHQDGSVTRQQCVGYETEKVDG